MSRQVLKENRTGPRTSHEPLPDFDAQGEAVADDLQRKLDTLKLPGLRVAVAKRLFERDVDEPI